MFLDFLYELLENNLKDLTLQEDTFISKTEKTSCDNCFDIVIYRFRQSERLNPRVQREFDLVLFESISASGLKEVSYGSDGKDSWFVGYYWKVLVEEVCDSHVGWVFRNEGGKTFYANKINTNA